ncbi:MAG: glutamine--fructose-6-phosphate transaminase (isomerizing) [Phototrophicales bacterium]|nr:MAG: glutamine--fructose-6-phosphate transaminase (isomerizing) [Phototrophicales bacterium]
MCGIVGYIGPRQASSIILNGLHHLEYRGYDSAGIAVLTSTGIVTERAVGKLINLIEQVNTNPIEGSIGIGHTRWATHGVPSVRNSHPHASTDGSTVVVHNGIIENFVELREELEAEGVTFASDTDTEVAVHLIDRYMATGLDLAEATRQAALRLSGASALVVMSQHQPDTIVAVRLGNAGGVTIGVGENEMFVASDIPAILEHTRRILFLENRQMAIVRQNDYRIQNIDSGAPVDLEIHTIAWDPVSAAKGEYRHFMQKEIFEQARTLTDAMRGRINFQTGDVYLDTLKLTAEEARAIHRIVTVACGTSYYAGLVGKFIIERLTRIPVEVDYGSEYRYRDPILTSDDVLLAITQSGETVDTLAAMEAAQERGVRRWSIVNAIGSQAMRIADGYIGMQAGPEIGVASTKAYTASIVVQILLGLYLGKLRGTLSADDLKCYGNALAHLPELVSEVLERDQEYHELAGKLYRYNNFLYLGRGINYPTALEGALKLKEISYIHAEGYPAGEMKHGPIALIDENMPVVTIALRDAVYDKMISQVQQAKARGGIVIALATDGDTAIAEEADHVIYVPQMPEFLSPIVATIPLQLLAYHIAVWRGADVDQPRNLAKSVTVE